MARGQSVPLRRLMGRSETPDLVCLLVATGFRRFRLPSFAYPRQPDESSASARRGGRPGQASHQGGAAGDANVLAGLLLQPGDYGWELPLIELTFANVPHSSLVERG